MVAGSNLDEDQILHFYFFTNFVMLKPTILRLGVRMHFYTPLGVKVRVRVRFRVMISNVMKTS